VSALSATGRTGPANAAAGLQAARAVLSSLVRDVPDFPEPGVLFKDINPVLADPSAFSTVVDALAGIARAAGATTVTGIEARGFLLAAPVALATQARLVPIRKAGKLPGATAARTYDLEYGRATLEVQQDALRPGERVLLIDDVLATGGTAAAAAGLVSDAGAEVVGMAVLIELLFLKGRGRLPGLPVTALLEV